MLWLWVTHTSHFTQTEWCAGGPICLLRHWRGIWMRKSVFYFDGEKSLGGRIGDENNLRFVTRSVVLRWADNPMTEVLVRWNQRPRKAWTDNSEADSNTIGATNNYRTNAIDRKYWRAPFEGNPDAPGLSTPLEIEINFRPKFTHDKIRRNKNGLRFCVEQFDAMGAMLDALEQSPMFRWSKTACVEHTSVHRWSI